MSKNLIRAVKLFVSVGLIAYLIYAVDWERAAAELGHAQTSLVIVAVPFFLVNIATSAWKWQIALRIHGFTWRRMELAKILFIGLFVSNFLPTAIGGDIYRVYRTMPRDGHKSPAFSAVLLDRVTGLLALMFVGALGALVVYASNRDPAIGVLALALAAPPLIAAAVPFVFKLAVFRPVLAKLAGVRKLEPLVSNARSIVADKAALARLAGVSILYQVLAATGIALLFAAAGTPGVWARSAVVSAMYSMAALIPFSINGIGIQEGSFAFTAQQLGIGFNHAVIVSLMLRILATLISLAGGLVFLFDKGRVADMSMAAETVERLPD